MQCPPCHVQAGLEFQPARNLCFSSLHCMSKDHQAPYFCEMPKNQRRPQVGFASLTESFTPLAANLHVLWGAPIQIYPRASSLGPAYLVFNFLHFFDSLSLAWPGAWASLSTIPLVVLAYLPVSSAYSMPCLAWRLRCLSCSRFRLSCCAPARNTSSISFLFANPLRICSCSASLHFLLPNLACVRALIVCLPPIRAACPFNLTPTRHSNKFCCACALNTSMFLSELLV